MATLTATPTWAQSGGVFEITRSTIDGGGSTERSVDNVSIRGTIGQPDVGAASTGSTVLRGGFWASEGPFGNLFRDGFESGDTSAWSTDVGAAPQLPAPKQAQDEGAYGLARARLTPARAVTGNCRDGETCPGQDE